MEGGGCRTTMSCLWRRIEYIRFSPDTLNKVVRVQLSNLSYSLSAAYIRNKHDGQYFTSSRWTLNGKHSPPAIQIDIHMREIKKTLVYYPHRHQDMTTEYRRHPQISVDATQRDKWSPLPIAPSSSCAPALKIPTPVVDSMQCLYHHVCYSTTSPSPATSYK